MLTALRKMGNSTAMIVPKPLLEELGAACGTAMNVRVEGGSLIATPQRKVREGWAEAAAAIADEDDPELEDWLAFGNEADDEWVW